MSRCFDNGVSVHIDKWPAIYNKKHIKEVFGEAGFSLLTPGFDH